MATWITPCLFYILYAKCSFTLSVYIFQIADAIGIDATTAEDFILGDQKVYLLT